MVLIKYKIIYIYICQSQKNKFHSGNYSCLVILFFTVLSAFAVLNLFIGVIVDAVQETRSVEQTEAIKREVDQIDVSVEELSEAQTEAQQDLRIILKELKTMRAELAAMRPR